MFDNIEHVDVWCWLMRSESFLRPFLGRRRRHRRKSEREKNNRSFNSIRFVYQTQTQTSKNSFSLKTEKTFLATLGFRQIHLLLSVTKESFSHLTEPQFSIEKLEKNTLGKIEGFIIPFRISLPTCYI